MNQRPPPVPSGRFGSGYRSGFTLIELMIAVTIGLVMLVALLALFVNSSRSNNEMAKMNSLIENGRFAMKLLGNDISHAGFWGTYLPPYNDLMSTAAGGAPSGAQPDPCLAYNTTNWNATYKGQLIGIPIQAYQAPPTNCAGVVTNQFANTDVLIVRRVESCALLWNAGTSTWTVDPGSPNCEADTAGKLYFQASLQPLPTPTGCTAETSSYVLSTTGFTLHKGDCSAYPEKRKFISHIYYVRDYAVTAGDGIPTLMRSEFDLSGSTLAHQAAVALIEGIEGFRVEFGIDSLSKTGAAVDYTAAIAWQDPETHTTPTNRGDGMPDGAFVHCTTAASCTADQLTNVTVARLYLLVRTREATPGYQDTKTYRLGSAATATVCATTSTDSACTLKVLTPGYKRHVFSTTVRLINIAIRRETP